MIRGSRRDTSIGRGGSRNGLPAEDEVEVGTDPDALIPLTQPHDGMDDGPRAADAVVPGGASRVRGRPPSPNGASSFHLWWEVPEVPLASVSAILQVLVPPRVSRLAFFAVQASFWSPGSHEGGAHAGLQWNPRHPRSRAANWGGYDHRGSILEGTVSSLPSTPDDPNTRDFGWVTGARYRLTIGPRVPGSRNPGRWPARIEGLDTGEDVEVRQLLCEGDHLRAPVVWSELFARCDDPSARVRWSSPQAVTSEGSVVEVERARVTYQAYADGGCTNTTVETGPDGIVQRSGCERLVPHDAVVSWRA